MAEGDLSDVLELTREEMEKAQKSLRIDLQKIRTGRANTAVLDGIQVDYYGTPTPLNQLANLSTPDPRLIVVSPYDKGAMQAIERAIQAANLGLTPNSDGKVIRIPIPSLTEERRRDLVKQVKKLAEEHKVGVREARREGLKSLKDLQDGGDIPEDERHRGDKKVQELTDEHVKKIDEMIAQKEQDILQV